MERDVGIEVYLTTTRGFGGRIKVNPEDFVVSEIPILPPREEGGRYTAAWIRTRNWETNRLVRMMSRELRISRKRISFAGTKDKRALTSQLFQFDAPIDLVGGLRIKDVELLDFYQTSKKVEIGDLRGNRFDIIIRDIRLSGEETAKLATATAAELAAAGGFPNFFGVQRFGSIRPITHIVGRHIVRGGFKAAVDAYVANPIEGEDEQAFEVRTALEQSGDYGEALKTYPDVMSFEKAILNHLVKHPDDHIGALEQLPFNLLMMFVHGYQSYLFNRILSERIKRRMPLSMPTVGDVVMAVGKDGLPDDRHFVPVTGDNIEKVGRQTSSGKAFVTGVLFGSESTLAAGEMGEIEKGVVESEGLRPHDFTLPAMPRLSSKGTRRPLAMPLPRMDVKPSDGSVETKFELSKGCYATILLREFMKVDPLKG
jgi:tRNA pseudouridine13 synthase